MFGNLSDEHQIVQMMGNDEDEEGWNESIVPRSKEDNCKKTDGMRMRKIGGDSEGWDENLAP